MASNVAVSKHGTVLKWCFHCDFYEWAEHRDGRFICHKCSQPVRDWMSRCMYEARSPGTGRGVPDVARDIDGLLRKHAEPGAATGRS